MFKLLLTVALAAATPAFAGNPHSSAFADFHCAVSVRAFDEAGRARPTRQVSATTAPAVVFWGRASERDDDEAVTLIFDVFSPRGRLYQSLVATPRVLVRERGARRVERVSRTQEATLAVAGSSIAWTSLVGRWRVQPRIAGTDEPCGGPEYFTIRP